MAEITVHWNPHLMCINPAEIVNYPGVIIGSLYQNTTTRSPMLEVIVRRDTDKKEDHLYFSHPMISMFDEVEEKIDYTKDPCCIAHLLTDFAAKDAAGLVGRRVIALYYKPFDNLVGFKQA